MNKLTGEQESRLKFIFNLAGAPEATQKFWTSRLQTVPEEAQDRVMAFFEMFPEKIGWLAELQARKEKAMAAGDEKLWEEIMAEEEKHFSTIVAEK